MELTDEVLENVKDSAKIMASSSLSFNKQWYDVVISLIKEIKRLRKKYE